MSQPETEITVEGGETSSGEAAALVAGAASAQAAQAEEDATEATETSEAAAGVAVSAAEQASAAEGAAYAAQADVDALRADIQGLTQRVGDVVTQALADAAAQQQSAEPPGTPEKVSAGETGTEQTRTEQNETQANPKKKGRRSVWFGDVD